MTNTLTIPYPDSLLDDVKMSNQELEQEAKMLLALKLFDDCKISSGQAAQLAGMSRVDFLYKAGEMRSVALMPDADELLGDIGNA